MILPGHLSSLLFAFLFFVHFDFISYTKIFFSSSYWKMRSIRAIVFFFCFISFSKISFLEKSMSSEKWVNEHTVQISLRTFSSKHSPIDHSYERKNEEENQTLSECFNSISVDTFSKITLLLYTDVFFLFCSSYSLFPMMFLFSLDYCCCSSCSFQSSCRPKHLSHWQQMMDMHLVH
jgi:hypothetical protein